MKKRTFLIFTLYTWGRILYGLILHPYKTIREIVRKPVFIPVALSPLLGIGVLFFLGRAGAFLIDIYGIKRDVIAMVLSTSLFSLVLWQLFLLYLLISLISARRKES